MAQIRDSLHVRLGAAGKQNEGEKIRLLPFTIAVLFIQLHYMSRGGHMLCMPERKSDEGEKTMKVVRKTDKRLFPNAKETAGIKRLNGNSNITTDLLPN